MNAKNLIVNSLLFLVSTYALHAQDYKTFYAKGVEAFDAEKDSLGYVYLTKAIDLKPDYYEALYARAYYLMSAGIYDLASQDYEKLTELKPNNPKIHYYKANSLFYLNAFDEAEDSYKKAYALDSNNVEHIEGLAILYYSTSDYKRAKYYINRALKQKPNNKKSYYYNALINQATKKYREALANVERGLKVKPNDPELLRLKAKINLSKRSYAQVIETYEKFEDLYPKGLIIEDFLHWATALYKLKKLKTAEFYLLTPQNHKNADIFYLLAKIKKSTYDYDASIAYLDSTIKYIDAYAESSSEIFYNRAFMKYRKRKQKEGKEDYYWSLYLMPEIYEQKNFSGEKLNLFGNCNIVYKANQDQKKIDSIRIEGHHDRCVSFLDNGDFQNAVKETTKVQKIDPKHVNNYILKATCQTLMNENRKGISTLDSAFALAKKDEEKAEILYARGIIYEELEEYKTAIKNLDDAIKIDNKNAEYYAHKAACLFNSKKLDKAIININKAIQIDNENAQYYTNRALYYIEQKNNEASLRDANTALKFDDSNILAYYARGLSLMKLKKYQKALEDFNLILSVFPEDKEVKELQKTCKNHTN